MNAEGRTPEWYVDHIERDAARVAAAVETGPLDAKVAACPGWDLRRLTVHLGVVHRWARHCATYAKSPDGTRQFEPGDRDLGEWFREGAADLVATLREIDHEGPTWHPFAVARIGRVWPRRQAHETAIHRWDAEAAIGEPAPVDAELASDGIDEYFEVVVPRLVARERIVLPQGSFHVHCTDVDGEWLVWTEGGEYRMERAHRKGDAALRGPADAILLRLWGRTESLDEPLGPVGDESVLAAWLSIAGM